MKKSLVLLLAGIFFCIISGCGGKYTHPTRAADRWENDYAMCVTEADYQVDFHPYQTDAAHPYESKLQTYSDRYNALIRRCMACKGYTYEKEETWMDSVKQAVQYK